MRLESLPLRRLHLLEDPAVEQFITKFPAPGDNTISRKMTSKSPGFESTGKGVGKVWINDDQYFADVPEVAWNFYIGGYQPAQKWLKDRVDRQLTFDDIRPLPADDRGAHGNGKVHGGGGSGGVGVRGASEDRAEHAAGPAGG